MIKDCESDTNTDTVHLPHKAVLFRKSSASYPRNQQKAMFMLPQQAVDRFYLQRLPHRLINIDSRWNLLPLPDHNPVPGERLTQKQRRGAELLWLKRNPSERGEKAENMEL